MKAFLKVLSTATVVAMVSTSLSIPFVSADESLLKDRMDERKNFVIQQLEQQSSQSYQLQSQSLSSQTVVTEIEYKQQIDYNQIHEYFFTTRGGEFTVEALHGNADDPFGPDYFIYEMNSEEIIEPIDYDTFELSEGAYYLVVMGYSEEKESYQYRVKGEFSNAPDSVLPKLTVNNPASADTRLPKDSAPNYPVSGSSDAVKLNVTLNYEQEVALKAPGLFKWDHLVLGQGYNFLTFEAMKLGGNKVISFYSVTLPGVSRIQGNDRYHVSSNVSRTLRYWGYGSGTVVITRGDLYPDAVSGGPLAFTEDAPILLTNPKSLPYSVMTELENIQPERAIILGGPASVSPDVEEQLEDLGIEVDRIGGNDRYAVSASIAERVADQWGEGTAIIASGEAFPDALSASTIAGPSGMPILLVKKDGVPAPIETFIKNNPNIENFIIIGGPAAVNESVATKLKRIRSGAEVERIGGSDRYEVSVNVAKYGINNLGMDASTLTFARGDLFPDALSGAPLANMFYAPVILTPANKMHSKVSAFLTAKSSEIDNIYILGGTGAISPDIEKQLNRFIK
ncbi:cell wall-binding repeat-containing protein [Mesobacillus selenatarsenatis]|uniref:N-acetylmuramoyl-L-alanine amidase n=1 Tax=Mesobacillus selenatarsenatis (strain DSM 18680 / JCM 14380 / FERM P-15431 / SF-1) TaxID=1321606 RepID=A0A0A8X8C8_MESS1|nr:cell wall-binding repeat-containing protein [Mesobacillus selenatarsenatis]GAM16220.1 N-acetylmuramoyl-L-alanine amidase [Mesobacillus selenatarsenatis SF-1]